MRKIKSNPYLKTALGLVVGAIAGFLYWKFVGCSSGTCAITSSPLNSTLYFAGLGALLSHSVFPSNKTQTN